MTSPSNPNNTLPQYLQMQFKLRHAWGIIGMYLIITVAVSLPVGMVSKALCGQYESAGASDWALLAISLATYFFLFLFLYRSYRYYYASEPLVERNPVGGSLYALLLMFTISFSICVEPVVNWMNNIWLPEWIKELIPLADIEATVPMFLLAVVVAPICEELMFRGVILRGLLTTYSPVYSILWSAFLFGLIHINPAQVVFAFIIGVIIGWVYWKTRSLWACIFMHFVNNLFVMACTYAAAGNYVEQATIPEVFNLNPALVYGVAILLLGVSAYAIWEKLQPKHTFNEGQS